MPHSLSFADPQKRLYIFAGFDDYRIAEFGRVVSPEWRVVVGNFGLGASVRTPGSWSEARHKLGNHAAVPQVLGRSAIARLPDTLACDTAARGVFVSTTRRRALYFQW